MSGERAFSFSRGVSATMGAGAGVGAGAGTGARARTGAGAGTWASRTVLRIRCKLSSEYLGIPSVAAGALATGGFVEGPARFSENLLPDSGDGEESGGVTKGVAEERSQRGRLQTRIKVILELISSKNTLPNGLADPLGMEKLEL